MTESKKTLGQIIDKHKDDKDILMPLLFQMLATEPEQSHDNIKRAILFSMENFHQWSNIMKYSNKWKLVDFQKSFIDRMRKRLNEDVPALENDSPQEMKRLVEKYWKTRSPKKQQGAYKEPINIKKMMRNINAQSFTPKDQHLIGPVNPPIQAQDTKKIEQSKPENLGEKKEQTMVKVESIPQINEKVQTNQVKVHRGESFGPESQDSNPSSNITEKRQKDPLAAVTGRPPILKKRSIFDSKPNTNDNNEQKKKDDNKGRMASSKIFNIMRKLGDKDDNKSMQNWENFGKPKESTPPIINKANQQFPVDKFNFGSSKKGSGDTDVKKISISPRKYDPNTKPVRIVRNQQKEEKRPDFLHQFSFASSEQKESAQLAQELPTFKQPESNFSQKTSVNNQQHFVFHDTGKESDKEQHFSGENQFKSESFKRLKEVADTPVFLFDSKKRRSSGGLRSQQIFEANEALNLYHDDVQLRYFVKEVEGRNGADTMTIFQEEFSRFLKNPEAFRI